MGNFRTHNVDSPLPDEQLDNTRTVLRCLKETTRHRHFAVDCSRALDVLPMLEGKTIRDVLGVLASVHPARHPVTNDPARLRISKPLVRTPAKK